MLQTYCSSLHTSCFCSAANSCSLFACDFSVCTNMLLTLECKISMFGGNVGIEHVTILWDRCTRNAYFHLIAICGAFPGLGPQTDPLNPLKPIPLGRAMAREQESPTAACTFPQTSSSTISLQMRGGVMGADGLTPQGVRAHPFASSLLLCSFTARRVYSTIPGWNE